MTYKYQVWEVHKLTNRYVILGVAYGGHDTSAALLIDGKLVAACEQERFDLVKHSRAFPTEAIDECMNISDVSWKDIDEISVGFDHIDMIRKVYLQPALEDTDRLDFLIKDIERIKTLHRMEAIIREETGFDGPVNLFRHHKSHLASAYYPSGFEDALLLSYDGMGEIETGMIGRGIGGKIEILDDNVWYPHSLGLFYSAITYFLGWKHHSDEGIIMGLAPFGDYDARIPDDGRTYLEVFEEIIEVTGSYSYEINLDWIAYHQMRDTWVSEQFKTTFGEKRESDDPILSHHKNIAAALQKRLEDVVLGQLSIARDEFGLSKLCFSGGVGLNCSLNGKIAASGLFDEIFVQPASGDAGVSIGSALLAEADRPGSTLKPEKNHNYYLGSRPSQDDLKSAVENSGHSYEIPDDLSATTAEYLSEGLIVGWFQDQAEFGPRALGNRSILCRPYPEEQRDHINSRVKFREEFRPFAPAVLAEHAADYFQINQESPHMLIACQVQPSKRDVIPAVVHIDGTCRVQTVKKADNPRFYELLTAFNEKTNCPVLLNTSFNVKGQPIINNPKQAIDCFMSTEIDVLVVGDYLLRK
jgi:carbamoyltransferase